MKTKLFILALIGACQFALAQPELLTDNIWYLEKLIVDDTVYYPPLNDESSIHPFILDFDLKERMMITGYCRSDVFWTDIVFLEFNRFNVDNYSFFPMTYCSNRENLEFSNFHIDFFRDNTLLPFTYTLVGPSTDLQQLIIVSGDGSQAIYNSQRLSTSRFEKSTFKIFPNPVRDQLQFEWDAAQTFSPLQLEIYDISGKLCLKQQLVTEQKSIPLQNLSSGMYIVKVKNQSGVLLASEKILVQPR
ncbi:T9SS type A sorting domain-containing protein [Flavobacterium sp. NKUCC04_CG]|uniref:T9SS type A sorting domain-containing protein n=1 Tax=Flavobacterium sp. NKUCC04_CG TaxID=2842121 RepID=UPI001C5B5BDA|nr:T9SS type A sorting domain-containing protein [Flavobacterium sp. NKUCC04_CG]MBW3520327.1 T9SS type A sorting domain-containing protein [Flavobacterium sp. NKUCC04_CG]